MPIFPDQLPCSTVAQSGGRPGAAIPGGRGGHVPLTFESGGTHHTNAPPPILVYIQVDKLN